MCAPDLSLLSGPIEVPVLQGPLRQRGLRGAVFALGLAAFAARLACQIARIVLDDPESCLRVFRSNRNAGVILFAALLLDAAFKRAF
jgi:4-hydroxybenzoate polyprenyltransferase